MVAAAGLVWQLGVRLASSSGAVLTEDEGELAALLGRANRTTRGIGSLGIVHGLPERYLANPSKRMELP